ncbi:MAG: hypothetical protein AMXMBFR57_35920 [Acidimicrobiia bacterium]
MRYSLESLSCTSWVVYATKSDSDAASRTRTLIVEVKKDRRESTTGRPFAALIIGRALERLGDLAREAFAGSPLLVPIPGSGLTKANTVWSSRRVCQELVAVGLGDSVAEVVQRVVAVPKSAWTDQRPSFETHYRSLAVAPTFRPPSRLLVVDDVVTSGTTMMACAQKLADAFPGVPIAGFALSRTLSQGEPSAILDPRTELIRHRDERCARG